MMAYSLAALLTAVLLLALARGSSTFAEWYACRIFPFFPHTIGRIFSLLPFSLFELSLFMLAVALLPALAYCAFSLFSPAGRGRLRAPLIMLFSLLAALFLLFTLTCGINYSRNSVAAYVGIERRAGSKEDLQQLYEILRAQAEQLCLKVERDEEGLFLPQDTRPKQSAVAAMQALSHKYEGFISYFPNPKPVFFSPLMSRLQISGIYSPFTVEANYNNHMPALSRPFTMCHELAHLSGFMREDEANFIAYLACLGSQEADFQYSGNFYALIYVLNALYTTVSPEEYGALYESLPQPLRGDLRQNSAYWQEFEGVAAELSESMNDFYLKANLQAEGVRSYNLMVDLLLAYYLGRE